MHYLTLIYGSSNEIVEELWYLWLWARLSDVQIEKWLTHSHEFMDQYHKNYEYLY